jgi:transcriptional regulator with XRE-family HTH domain
MSKTEWMKAEISKEEIGKAIKNKREEFGWSQKQLAEYVGITPAALSQFEKGLKCPSLQTIATLALQLAVSVDWLIEMPN